MRIPVIIASILVASSVQAGEVKGRAIIIDGDTIKIGDERIRLAGIDAPEKDQFCVDDAKTKKWPVGAATSAALAETINGEDVTCAFVDAAARDKYGRVLGTCWQAGASVTINEMMVASGLAYAYRKYSAAYILAEENARRRGRGVWEEGVLCLTPEAWRAGSK